jgi:hypothetical protein
MLIAVDRTNCSLKNDRSLLSLLTDLKSNQDEAQKLFENELRLNVADRLPTAPSMDFNMAEVVADAVQIK